jgi:dCMP deaminase
MYINIAKAAADNSYCVRRKVGACIVTLNGLISIGMNGTAPGKENICELPDGTTKSDTIHAEINAIKKFKNKADLKNSILFTTTAPCINCATSIADAGIKEVVYLNAFSKTDGVDYLIKQNIKVIRINYG